MIIKKLTKKYNGKPVVDEIDFTIPKGKVISFIGQMEQGNQLSWE